MDSTTTDSISAISEAVQAVGVVLICWQILLMKKQTRNDHERSSRERTIDLFGRWNDFERTEGHLAIATAERLDTDGARAVWTGKPILLPAKYKGTIERFLSRQGDKHSLTVGGEHLEISADQSLELRSGMIECMNLLETIFSAARHGVADRHMIEEQYGCLIDPDPTRHKTMMRTLREVAGGATAFPSTTEFDRLVLISKQKKAPGKADLDA